MLEVVDMTLTHFSIFVTFLGDVPDETHAKTQPRPSDGSGRSGCPASPAGPEPGSALGSRKRQGSRARQGRRGCCSQGRNSGASAKPAQSHPANQLLCYRGNTLPFRPASVQDRVGWRDPVQAGQRGRPDGPQRPLPHRLHLCHPSGAHELVEELEENESEEVG